MLNTKKSEVGEIVQEALNMPSFNHRLSKCEGSPGKLSAFLTVLTSEDERVKKN